MKGIFSIWAFFGVTLWIDLFCYFFLPQKSIAHDSYNPVRTVSVIIPVHCEPVDYISQTVKGVFAERYPVLSVIVIGDTDTTEAQKVVSSLSHFKNLYYIESPEKSKAQKVNYLISQKTQLLGEYIYIRDCRVIGNIDCIEKMVSYFTEPHVGAVTSYGRVSAPRNRLSRAYFYGKSWVNEIGRFRKHAQEKRGALFVVCGASTMYRREVLQKIPLSYGTKTEDTFYTWRIQQKGYTIRVADDATVSAPEVDGEGWDGIRGQIKQSYRWTSGTFQCMYRNGPNLFSHKRLAYTTILPGFIESVMYTIPLAFSPLLFFVAPRFALGFLIGDTFFSLLGTLLIIPQKFSKTLVHYPEIVFFEYINGLIFIAALSTVTYQAIFNKTESWSNVWKPPATDNAKR